MEIKLNELNLNMAGIVKQINCSDNIKTRLLDLGIINGTKVIPIFRSMLGDPTAYMIRGSILAIRKNDANEIIVLPEDTL